MGSADFYIDYDSEVPDFTNDLKAEVEKRLRDLAGEDTDMVGAAVAVTAPGRGAHPYLYQARVVVYARPEDIAAVKQDKNVQIALRDALAAVERQVHEKRERLGKPWERSDLQGKPPIND
jgi:ribosome-associated translation inhibitor RaiA